MGIPLMVCTIGFGSWKRFVHLGPMELAPELVGVLTPVHLDQD
jgi:hypothetical protein